LKICFAVSPIGLGHASRSVAIGLELKNLGYHIDFLTGGPAINFLSSYGFNVIKFHEKIPYFNVSKSGVLKGITRWMINYIMFYKRTKKKALKFLDNNDCEFVVSDEDFATALIAMEKGIRTVFITDLIQTEFAKNWIARIIEKRTNEWFRWFFEKAPITIVPEEEGERIGNMYFIGPVVRKLNSDPESIKKKLGLDGKMILVTSGGTPIGEFLFRKVTSIFNKLKNKMGDKLTLVLVGKGSKKYFGEPDIIVFETYRDLQELVAASDLVITTAGKSTIDECRVYRTPCIAIPIKGHYEQERNAKKLGYSYDDINNLEELILEQIKEPKIIPAKNNLDEAIRLINGFFTKRN